MHEQVRKSSTWTPASTQKKSKSLYGPRSFSIQPKSDTTKSSQSQEIPTYSTEAADRLAANVMRSMETQQQESLDANLDQEQHQSKLGGISIADIVMQRSQSPSLGLERGTIQRQDEQFLQTQLYNQTASVQNTTSLPLIQLFPGHRVRHGYKYGGGGSSGFTRRRVNELIENEYQSSPQLADACRVFLQIAPMEGWISAINTWDSQIFTWGAGFANGGMLNRLWRHLDRRVKSHLASHPQARNYFRLGGLNITESIRTDTDALDAVVYVSENEPYREDVLQAQLRAFMTGTMGMEVNPTPDTNFATRDIGVLSLAAHLRHWTPAFFDMPGDLERAVTSANLAVVLQNWTPSPNPFDMAGAFLTYGQTIDQSALAAAVIRIHAHKMLNSGDFGRNQVGGRRVLKEAQARRWEPVRRYQRNLRELLGNITITSSATSLIPAFQSGSDNFFVSVTRLQEIPENHYVMRQGSRYYDFGSRN